MNIQKRVSQHKSFIESFFSLSILNGLNVLLPLITLPYMLRIIGPEKYGMYLYVYAIIQYVLLITAYGFNYSATKQIVFFKEQPNKIIEIYNSVIACRLLLFLAGIVLLLVLSPLLFNSNIEIIMMLMGLGIILGDIFVPTWLFQGMEKMRYLTIVNASAKILFTILIFTIIKKPEDFVFIILLNSCGFLLSGVLSTIIAIKSFHLRLSIPTWTSIKFQIKDGWALFCSTIGINLYRESNIIILKFFVSDAAVGIYGAAEKVIKGLQLVTTPIAQALFPHLGNSFKKLSLSSCLLQLKKVSLFFSGILLLLTIIAFFAAKPLVYLLCGEDFFDAVFLVKIMCPIIFFGSMNYLLGVVGLVNLNQQKKFVLFVLLSGFISIIFLLSTVSLFGVVSASIAMLLSEILLFACCSFSLLKMYNKTVCI